jgi:hypothetical protein
MVVFRSGMPGDGPAVQVERAGLRALGLLPRRRPAEIGLNRSRGVRPLKRRDRREGRGGRWRRLRVLLVARDAERGELLQQRPAARLRRGDGGLGFAHGPQLVLRHLRQILDLRHAGATDHGLSRRRRNELRLLRIFRFAAGLDRFREARGRRCGRLGVDFAGAGRRSGRSRVGVGGGVVRGAERGRAITSVLGWTFAGSIWAIAARSMPVATTETRTTPSSAESKVAPRMMLASSSTSWRMRLAASSTS